MTTAVQRILDSFDALPELEKHQAAVEIMRRLGPAIDEDVPGACLLEAADELFTRIDNEEATAVGSHCR